MSILVEQYYSNLASSSNESKLSLEDSYSEEDSRSLKIEEQISPFSTCPFKLKWSIGLNANVSLVNLTTANRTLVAYACSHVIMLYDYISREYFPLQGHQNVVKALSTTLNGKWLLTADFHDEYVLIVWDTELRLPICSLFNPHNREGMTAARISPNAKYIVTVGNENRQKVCFWLWTFGRNQPDATVELPEYSDKAKEIVFNEEVSNQFALTFNRHVLLFTWNDNVLTYGHPKISKQSNTKSCGIFTASCYMPKTDELFTATTNGSIVVWGSRINSQERTHIKTIRLEKHSITAIVNYESMVVTGNSVGYLKFYDYKLRLLYWCQNLQLDSIRTISFNVQSGLFGPTLTSSQTSLGPSYEVEMEKWTRDDVTQEGDGIIPCSEKQSCAKEVPPSKEREQILSKMITLRIEHVPKHFQPKNSYVPTDATLEHAPFTIRNFMVCTNAGSIALLDIPNLKCYFLSHNLGVELTSLDIHPNNKYLVTGDAKANLSLYDCEKHTLITCRPLPPVPDIHAILKKQEMANRIVYASLSQVNKDLTTITALKYSPKSDLLVCGLENGLLWILHPLTLKPIDENPYKHTRGSVRKIVFTECAKYMAFADNATTVCLFHRNEESLVNETYMWDFFGKYHAHAVSVADILFVPPICGSVVPRFFSLGEDQLLIEYDIERSGPYPDPGLTILHSSRIETNAIPLCFALYPPNNVETFLVVSNSEHKYRLVNDMTSAIRGTYLSPTFGSPIYRMEILEVRPENNQIYMVFASQKVVGLQLLPLDGNPFKSVGIVAHPGKIRAMLISSDGNTLFTMGENDSCVLIWKINFKSVDTMYRLGGEGIAPFYSLINGGGEGWLANEIKDLFYYAQILQQGENTTATRSVSDKISTKQIPNLMRAIGCYPSTEELEILMAEVAYRHYAESGELVEQITFEEFVKLYVNHRPAFGYTMSQMKEAFQTILGTENESACLSREQFVDVLLGKARGGILKGDGKPFGDPLTLHEAHMYLKSLILPDQESAELFEDSEGRQKTRVNFDFLPPRISYKDFVTEIMGIEGDITRADNEKLT